MSNRTWRRELVLRVAVAVAWALFGMTFIDASMYDQAAQDSVARRSLWVVAAVLSFLVAIGIVAFFCTRLGCIPWISASKKSWHSWISVLVIAAVGLGLFLLAELGRIDARPLWLRIQIL